MTHTDDDTVLATAIRDLINLNKADLGVSIVLYGNHIMVQSSPAVVVKAAGKDRTLIGVQGPGGRTDNGLNIVVEVHISEVGDEETERRKVDSLATSIEHLLHSDTTIGGIIIHGFVTSATRGDTLISGSMFRSVIMTFAGRTRTLIS
jgi:hypothetical protein